MTIRQTWWRYTTRGIFASAVAAAAFITNGCSGPPVHPWTGEVSLPRPVTGSAGMVTSDARLATDAGIEILNAGGNAIDAAVATAFTLAVVYPEAGNLGGGGFLVARLAGGNSVALDFRERAPFGATRDMYLDSVGAVSENSLRGHLASGVPGSVAGLWEAHRVHGSLPWARVLAPAIRLAREGFVIDERFARTLREDSSQLLPFAGSARLFFRDGRPLDAGMLWTNRDLAESLDRIAERGMEGFYSGRTAELIVAEMRRGGGIISDRDLADYRAVWRPPVQFTYRGHRVISMPPPSSGGVTLACIAGILDQYDLPRMAWHSPEELHLTAEAMRRAFAVRNAFLGDPEFVHVPVDSLLSSAFLAAQQRSIDLRLATPSLRVAFDSARVPQEPVHTTHLSVVDGRGNAVALTTTINGLYGSGVTVDGGGFLLNNEMDDFAAKPGAPNMFGLVQGEANAIAPGKRILSSMTPTIVCDSAGAPVIVTGARGGPYIITAVFQVIANLLDHSMELPGAVAAPRVHHQHLPDRLLAERNAMDSTTAAALLSMGHRVERARALGSAPTLARRGTQWIGVCDPRTGGAAAAQQALP